MRRALYVAALAALAAPLAHAQTLVWGDSGSGPGQEASVYLRPIGGQSVEAMAMARLVHDALETSRQLNRVDMQGETVLQLEAPVTLTRTATGAQTVVTFEITPVRGIEQSFSTTCPTHQPDRCADAIVLRAEKMAREGLERP